MSWSIAEVARMAGTTSRTLRHYDAIGLLTPAYVAPNGVRHYDEPQLRRLQRILLLREMSVPLAAIAAVIDGTQDEVTALRTHHAFLLRERDRVDRLTATVQRTIETMEGRAEMSPQELFAGFEHNPYETEAVERWGAEVVDGSKERVRGWTEAQAADAQRGWAETLDRLRPLLDEGATADDPRVLDVVAGHHAWLCGFWTPDATSYAGLARMYADDPRFRDQIDAVRPGLADYLEAAMTAYAAARL